MLTNNYCNRKRDRPSIVKRVLVDMFVQFASRKRRAFPQFHGLISTPCFKTAYSTFGISAKSYPNLNMKPLTNPVKICVSMALLKCRSDK